jgi:hypothetical protein
MPSFRERQEPDRDPAVARRTSLPCAIEDGEAPATAWGRLRSLMRRRKARGLDLAAPPPAEPESIPETPEDDPPSDGNR